MYLTPSRNGIATIATTDVTTKILAVALEGGCAVVAILKISIPNRKQGNCLGNHSAVNTPHNPRSTSGRDCPYSAATRFTWLQTTVTTIVETIARDSVIRSKARNSNGKIA